MDVPGEVRDGKTTLPLFCQMNYLICFIHKNPYLEGHALLTFVLIKKHRGNLIWGIS